MAEHGLNYLYLLPQVWGEYDAAKKSFVDPQALVEEMYRKARIDGVDLRAYIRSASPALRRRTAAPPAVSTTTPASAESTPPLKSATENASSTPAVDDKTIKNIQTLCKKLQVEEPAFDTLSAQSAKTLLKQLTNTYKASRKREESVPDAPR